MKKIEYAVIAGTAAATMAIGSLLPGMIQVANAKNETQALTLLSLSTDKPAAPKPIVEKGVSIMAELDKASYQAGESPVVTLTLINTRNQEAPVKLGLSFSSVLPTSPMSRVGPMPVQDWTTECDLTLKPLEKKTLSYTIKRNSFLSGMGTLRMSAGNKSRLFANVPFNGLNLAQTGQTGPVSELKLVTGPSILAEALKPIRKVSAAVVVKENSEKDAAEKKEVK